MRIPPVKVVNVPRFTITHGTSGIVVPGAFKPSTTTEAVSVPPMDFSLEAAVVQRSVVLAAQVPDLVEERAVDCAVECRLIGDRPQEILAIEHDGPVRRGAGGGRLGGRPGALRPASRLRPA